MPPGVVRTMSGGTYFGEISPLFDCKRSSTVIARVYGTYGAFNKDGLASFLRSFPLIKVFMWENIMSVYDDELKLFLYESLKSVDYLAPLARSSPQILTHLGFCMEARLQEAGEHLFKESDSMGSDEFIIVYSGLIEIYTIMDDGTEFSIE